jgi:hypothetical protein
METNTNSVEFGPLVQGLLEKPLVTRFGIHPAETLQRPRRLYPLCHEHHLEMRVMQIPQQVVSEAEHAPVYACPEPSCLVRYNSSSGYFIFTQNRNGIERDMMPRICCSQDGLPMYLTGAHRSLRVWRCPQCYSSHRSQDDLLQPPLETSPTVTKELETKGRPYDEHVCA